LTTTLLASYVGQLTFDRVSRSRPIPTGHRKIEFRGDRVSDKLGLSVMHGIYRNWDWIWYCGELPWL